LAMIIILLDFFLLLVLFDPLDPIGTYV
jgi:hypothetical protein